MLASNPNGLPWVYHVNLASDLCDKLNTPTIGDQLTALPVEDKKHPE